MPNRALAATGGDGWMSRLDDDTLHVEGWQALLAGHDFGSTRWRPTNLTDQNGQRTPHWVTGKRHWGRHVLEEHWTVPMLFHPNNAVVETELALEVGGWPAMRANEDILWCFNLNQHEAGRALPHVTLRYRRWERQTRLITSAAVNAAKGGTGQLVVLWTTNAKAAPLSSMFARAGMGTTDRKRLRDAQRNTGRKLHPLILTTTGTDNSTRQQVDNQTDSCARGLGTT